MKKINLGLAIISVLVFTSSFGDDNDSHCHFYINGLASTDTVSTYSCGYGGSSQGFTACTQYFTEQDDKEDGKDAVYHLYPYLGDSSSSFESGYLDDIGNKANNLYYGTQKVIVTKTNDETETETVDVTYKHQGAYCKTEYTITYDDGTTHSHKGSTGEDLSAKIEWKNN